MLVALVAALLMCFAAEDSIYAQMVGPGRGSMGYGFCPMCGQQWDGHYKDALTVPASLPKPKSMEWVQKLREVLSIEKHSKAQYQADSNTYQVHMPYTMVIYQEDNHIAWISKLFTAYGIPSDGKILPIEKSGSLDKAYTVAIKLENDLIPRYEWLIKTAEDKQSAEILSTILLQTRMHSVMFQHASQMGGGMGYGMGRGGMGPGMMNR
jgi:rubrerythrin